MTVLAWPPAISGDHFAKIVYLTGVLRGVSNDADQGSPGWPEMRST
jgi:hypothetical protein